MLTYSAFYSIRRKITQYMNISTHLEHNFHNIYRSEMWYNKIWRGKQNFYVKYMFPAIHAVPEIIKNEVCVVWIHFEKSIGNNGLNELGVLRRAYISSLVSFLFGDRTICFQQCDSITWWFLLPVQSRLNKPCERAQCSEIVATCSLQ